jgi:hypothetical protein
VEAERIGKLVGTAQYGILQRKPSRTARPPGNTDHRESRPRAYPRTLLVEGEAWA